MPFNPPDYYGVNKKEKEKLKEWDRYESNNIKIYPDATVEEVRRKAKQVDIGVPYYEGESVKAYKKGNFLYSIDERNDVKALYIPSFDKELKIMFEWSSKKKKWVLLTYKEGNW